jgi:hypothetical protein
MPDGKQRIICYVSMKVGGEELAARRFHSVDDAAAWLLSTGNRLKGAVDAQLFEKISDKFLVDVGATVNEDGYSEKINIFSGCLQDAQENLLKSIRTFEETVQGSFHVAAEKAVRERRGRRLLWQISGAFAGAVLIAAGYYGLRLLPPMFDTDIMSDRLLSAPSQAFVGTWRPTGAADGCNSSRITFQRGQFELLVSGRQRVLNARYETPNSSTLKVEYTDGNVRVTQTFRSVAEAGTIQLVAVNATDADVQAAASRLVGTRFARCSPG